MKVVFVADNMFPFGTAGASRIRNFARGLTESGNPTFVLLLNPLPSKQAYDDHYYKGIMYESVFESKLADNFVGKPNKIRWYMNLLKGALYGRQRLSHLIDKRQIDSLIVYSWNALVMGPIIRLANSKKIPVIMDVVEWPTAVDFRCREVNPLYWANKSYKNLTKNNSDGVIVISSLIEKIYAALDKRTLKVPALAEPDMYESNNIDLENNRFSGGFEISYIGSLSQKNDPRKLVNVALALHEAGIPYRLNIIGSSHQAQLSPFLRTEEAKLIGSQIYFRGRLSEEYFKRVILESDLLLLPRQDNYSNRASFPTRLPELLLSGKPVVVSNVGDIADYLDDGVHAMLPLSGDSKEYSNRVLTLLKSKSLRTMIGINGRKRAMESFGYSVYAPHLLEFINLR